MIKRYDNLYPPSLWVTTYDKMEMYKKRFLFFDSVDALLFDKRDQVHTPVLHAATASATTWIVREKNTDILGILIALNMDFIEEGDYSFILDLVSHESGHAVDAIYQMIGETSKSFDDGNEPHSYLLGWVAGRIGEYLASYFKEINNGTDED